MKPIKRDKVIHTKSQQKGAHQEPQASDVQTPKSVEQEPQAVTEQTPQGEVQKATAQEPETDSFFIPAYPDKRFILRASSAGDFNKKGRNKEIFGETALSCIFGRVLHDVYGYYEPIRDRKIDKGVFLENDSIDLVNEVCFLNAKKNELRLTDTHFTGECDILLPDQIRDIKTVWSLGTFPFSQEQAYKKAKEAGYDLQGQVYMHLYGRDEFWVDFVLLPTPPAMLYGAAEKHVYHELVEKIPKHKRVMSIRYEKDPELIEHLKKRVDLAQEYYQECLTHLLSP